MKLKLPLLLFAALLLVAASVPIYQKPDLTPTQDDTLTITDSPLGTNPVVSRVSVSNLAKVLVLDGSNITSGTVTAARIDSAIARRGEANTFTGSSNVFSGLDKMVLSRPYTAHNTYKEGLLQLIQTNLWDHDLWQYVGDMGVESSIQVQAPDAGLDLTSDSEGYHGSYITMRNMSERNKQATGFQIYLTQTNFPTWGSQLMFIPMGTNFYPMDAEWTDWRVTMGTNVGAAGMSLGIRGAYPNLQFQDLNGNSARRIATLIYDSDILLMKTSRDDHSSPINAHSWDAFGSVKHMGTDTREVFYQSSNTSGERRYQIDPEADGDLAVTFGSDDASSDIAVLTLHREGQAMTSLDLHGSSLTNAAIEGDDITAGTVADARVAATIARLDSPTFTDSPSAPTQPAASSNLWLATTAYADRSSASAASTKVASGGTLNTDNRVVRANGTGGYDVQSSAVTVDDSGNMSGVNALTATSVSVSDVPYDATGWDGSTLVPTRNAVRDALVAAGVGAVSNYAELYVGDLILTNAIGVASGGTGLQTVTANSLLSGNGTNALDLVTIGTGLSLSGSAGSTRTLSATGGGTSYTNLSETNYTVTVNNLSARTNISLLGTNAGSLRLNDGQATEANSKSVVLTAPATVQTNYSLIMPSNALPGVAVISTAGATNATLSVISTLYTGDIQVLVGGGVTNLFQFSSGVLTNVDTSYP